MASIAADIQDQIQLKLKQIEQDHEVAILYACESGSRAWGFESTDSDYDVRFIYVRNSDWYLSLDLDRRRDVIELPIDGDLDVNGWDLRKALLLFRKTNAPLFEWLFSPIVYRQVGTLAERMRELAPEFYNLIAARHHYFRMASRTFEEYLQGDTVIRKKYLYALRPMLAVNWIDSGKGIVPMEFERLMAETIPDPEIKAEINEFLERKRAGKESDRGEPSPILQSYIGSQLNRQANDANRHAPPNADIEKLNVLFCDVLNESGSNLNRPEADACK